MPEPSPSQAAPGGDPPATNETLYRGFLLTIPAAFAGSVGGAFIFWAVTIFPEASPRFWHEGDPVALGLLLLFALPGWIFTTWPGLLVLGLPLSWPLRRLIVRHPLPAAVALALIGGGVSALIYTSLDRNIPFPEARTNVCIAFSYAGATAIAWVTALRRFRHWLMIETEPHG